MAPGFGTGKVLVYRPYLPELVERVLPPESVRDELGRFRRAVRMAERELRSLVEQVTHDMGPDFADFIGVQLAMLADPAVLEQAEKWVTERRRNAEFAYSETLKTLAAPLAGSTPLFKERLLDIADVSNRVLRHLLGDESRSVLEVERGTVLVARDLPPSDAALLDSERVTGLVLEIGGKTSHTAIMAKAKGIPAVAGAEGVAGAVEDGEEILVDGFRGLAIAAPSHNRLRAYDVEIGRRRRHLQSLSRLADEAPVTLNRKTIDLSANIEFLAEARAARANGALGVGLFRTEYMYLAKRRLPTEEEQYQAYAEVARMFDPHPVIIRTFDLGGDKVLAGYSEPNPFLGFRAIRLSLENLPMFQTQLRAILRASVHGNVKVMFPMVATVEELRRAKLEVEKAKRALQSDGLEYDDNFDVGVMVEIPSAAIVADRLARECSFLSVGSNDLTQYTLAVDRGNDRVARLFDPLHPAVLSLIKQTIDAAHRHGIWSGLCGEFGSDPLGVFVLLGLGIDEISVSAGAVPETKNIIRAIDTEAAADVVALAMKGGTALEVQRTLRREIHRRFPALDDLLSEARGGGNARP